MFYTNVAKRFNKIYFRGYDKGLRVNEKIDYKPYLFLPNKDGEYRTLEGERVKKVEFSDMNAAREFTKQFETVSNFRYFGMTHYEYVYINDKFKGDIDYDPKIIRIGNIDIECAADQGFPDIQKADKEITAITIRSRGKNFVFGCGDYASTDHKTYYIKCENEYELFSQFLDCWKVLDLDIITGWNIEFFDIPYLVNRMKVLYEKDVYKKLSPWGFVDEKMARHHNKEQQTYVIGGIATLDYYQLYRKFTFGNQESYKLDFIAEIEVGEKKINYSEYGSLLELYKKNFQKFIEYNVHDVMLVDKLDNKLKFLEQVMALAYDAKVNYIDTMTTVRPWDVIIHNYLLEKGIVIPQSKKNTMEGELMGGHVKEPVPGMYKWVVSFDLNSLYPHLIMQYGISHEHFKVRKSSINLSELFEITSLGGVNNIEKRIIEIKNKLNIPN